MEYWSRFAETLVDAETISYNTSIVIVTVCGWHVASRIV
jgi:hypothetical protein